MGWAKSGRRILAVRGECVLGPFGRLGGGQGRRRWSHRRRGRGGRGLAGGGATARGCGHAAGGREARGEEAREAVVGAEGRGGVGGREEEVEVQRR